MKTFRQAELYATKRIVSALKLAASLTEGETAENLADMMLCECLEKSFPGLLAVVDESDNRYEATRNENKKCFSRWKDSKFGTVTAKVEPKEEIEDLMP